MVILSAPEFSSKVIALDLFYPLGGLSVFLLFVTKWKFSLEQEMIMLCALFIIALYCLKAVWAAVNFILADWKKLPLSFPWDHAPGSWLSFLGEISVLVVPCDEIFIKVLPTKCHGHIKNIMKFEFQNQPTHYVFLVVLPSETISNVRNFFPSVLGSHSKGLTWKSTRIPSIRNSKMPLKKRLSLLRLWTKLTVLMGR